MSVRTDLLGIALCLGLWGIIQWSIDLGFAYLKGAGRTPIAFVDASPILAGPLCAQVLGDYGADVVKVEQPGRGDGMRGHGLSKDGVPLWWKMVSRNKRTIALDLRERLAELPLPKGASIKA